MRRGKRWLIGLAILAAGAYGEANANPIDCEAGIADNVVTNSGCVRDLVYTNDTEEIVNGVPGDVDPYFGFSDWVFDDKFPEGTPFVTFTGNGSEGTAGTSGTWALPGGWGELTEIMLVFKDGSIGGTALGIVAYLLTPDHDGTSGTWSTPFLDPPFTGAPEDGKDVSHISVYYRGGTPPSEIPEPTSLLLLGSGLTAVGLVSLRRRIF